MHLPPRSALLRWCVLVSALVAQACAVEPSDASADADYTARRARGSEQPLSGDEVRFEPFLHLDASTAGHPSHRYMKGSARTKVAGKTLASDVALYLERDRSFTLYYTELELVDSWNGTARARRKLVGTWRAEGDVLQLGAASAKIVKGRDTFGHEVDGLVLTLPEGWASAGAPTTAWLPLYALPFSNVGPDAPYWSDHR